MGLAEDLVQGFANAAGATDASQSIENKKTDRRATQREELQAQSKEIFEDVKRLQDRRAALDPKSPSYNTDLADIDASLTAHQQAFTDLYHPEKNPGALAHLGGFLREHLGGPKQQPNIPATPAEAKQSMAQRWASAAGKGTSPLNPYSQKATELKAAFPGMSDEEIQRISTGQREERPTKYSDYASGLRRFVTAEGGDPDNPTAAQEEAFRQQRLKDAAAGRAMDTTRTSTTTDPFGVTSTTNSTLKRRPAGSGDAGAPASSTPVKTPKEAKDRMKSAASAGTAKLDESGHIPTTAKVNPQLREAANNLIDGMDVGKLPIPQRDRAAAEQLAKQYGWTGQGMFGPKDKLLIRESTGILKQFAASPSLSVLDDATSRLKIQQVFQNSEKRGMIGQGVQNLVAFNLSPAESEFVTLYNQSVGRISGLSQLVRSGRATEAQIERLKTELPNPATTTSSAHAKQKFAQIQNEIDIALDKGQFVDNTGGAKAFKIGNDVYDIPADKVDSFKKKHPDAQEQ